ncbi:MAG: helicase associated domain-containing protein, partial [Oscillospiraceae bacterium]|nr:helicase associated domain-containing protein [Oscillospiraceae bacterium]
MRWKTKAELAWECGYEEAKRYAEEHGAADAPIHYVSPDGYKLGVFLSKCREKYGKGTLCQEKIDMLNEIGMVWNKSRA